MTGISRIATASVNTGATPASTFTINKPSGTASGHYMIATLAALGTTMTWTPPSGWTQIGTTEAGTTTMRSVAYGKFAGSSEPSTYSWTLGTTFKGFGEITTYDGVDATSPVDAYNNGAVTPAASTAALALTSVAGNAWMHYSAIGRHAFGSVHALTTSDGSDTNLFSNGSSSGSGFDYAGAAWDSNRDLSSGSQARTIGTATGTEQYSWQAISLTPAASASPVLRVYMGDLAYPLTTTPLRLRVYRAALENTFSATRPTLRVYRASLMAPRGDSVGGTGLWVVASGTLRRVALYSLIGGELT